MSILMRPTALVLATLLLAGGGLSLAEEGTLSPDATLKDIRARIRTEAGVTGQWDSESGVVWQYSDPELTNRGEDLPMVAVTILPGDTHELLSMELTRSVEAVAMIKTIAPKLTVGEKIMLPRTLLYPELSDQGRSSFALGKEFPTLKALIRAKINPDKGQAGAMTRNLMRLNAVTDATKIHKGAVIEIPNALLAKVETTLKPEATGLVIRDDYLFKASPGSVKVTKVKGVKGRGGRRTVVKKESWSGRLSTRSHPIDLVVMHTTEHSGTNFANVAAYIQRHGLANYIIGPNGETYRIVPEKYLSHGCGESLWNGLYETDNEAINIEIFADTAPGPKYSGISDAQYEGLKKLIADISARRPNIHPGRYVTHSMVAVSYKYHTRSRKGDPYEFDWAKASLPNNSVLIDQDVLLKRVSLCRDKRYADRVTPGQTAADHMLNNKTIQQPRAQ